MLTFRALSLLICLGAAVAQTPKIAGDYSGMLGPLHLKLHLKVGASGATEGTLDSPDQGATGLPCANFRLKEKAFSFDVPSVRRHVARRRIRRRSDAEGRLVPGHGNAAGISSGRAVPAD